MAEDQGIDNISFLESEIIRLDPRLAEMDKMIQTNMETGLNSRPLPRVVSDLKSTIIQGTSPTVLECMSLEVEELSQARYTDRFLTEKREWRTDLMIWKMKILDW